MRGKRKEQHHVHGVTRENKLQAQSKYANLDNPEGTGFTS